MLPGETDKPSSSAAPVEPLTTSLSDPPAGCPSYPPTEVQRWLICPVFNDYSAKWEPRVEAWTPHRLLGMAIHAGVAVHLRNLMDGSVSPATGPIASAIASLREGYVQQETWGLTGLEALVTKGTKRLTDSIDEKLLPGATILGVETSIEAGGRHRILDCTLQRGDTLEVWDWKASLRLDDRYLPDRLLEAHHSWQLLDYAWHGQAHFQRVVHRVGQGLLILGPKLKVEYSPVTVTKERLDQWRLDAETIWAMMGDGFMWHNWKACSDKHLHYGQRCPFYEGCHDLYGDESQFPGLYRPMKEKGA